MSIKKKTQKKNNKTKHYISYMQSSFSTTNVTLNHSLNVLHLSYHKPLVWTNEANKSLNLCSGTTMGNTEEKGYMLLREKIHYKKGAEATETEKN